MSDKSNTSKPRLDIGDGLIATGAVFALAPGAHVVNESNNHTDYGGRLPTGGPIAAAGDRIQRNGGTLGMSNDNRTVNSESKEGVSDAQIKIGDRANLSGAAFSAAPGTNVVNQSKNTTQRGLSTEKLKRLKSQG